jgi:RNA polymerase sigma-70 factor (ECF subfamily)
MNSIEQQFIAGLRNGDAACYESLVRDHGGRMLAVARRYLRNEADAGDCVQEAYLQAFRNIGSFEGRSSIESWLHRIVVNAALMKIRSRKRRPEISIEDERSQFDTDGQRIEHEVQNTLSVDEMLAKKQSRALVRRAIDQLPENARNLLLLRDIEGYSTGEVAALLCITQGAVKTGLHRARSKLKLLLAPMMREEKL